jgi:hypothetical protein
MKRISSILSALLLSAVASFAQKPFAEGVITYHVRLESPEHKVFTGTYIYTIKGQHLKRELKLNNGFEDVNLVNANDHTSYSLHTINGVKYAIQLNMEDVTRKQAKFAGYSVTGEEANGTLGGVKASRAVMTYKDGSGGEVAYTRDWFVSIPTAFERFPEAHFIPLNYDYVDENGISMRFEALKVDPRPVENAVFRMPAGYKIISYQEYQQLSK